MKTIKVFLASSDELKDERDRFGDLIRQLSDIFLPYGIHVKLLRWEDMDPCYNNVRKQDEYNVWIRQSDIFVCLFYTRAGKYTLEELNVAKQENKQRELPKMMIYMRDLKPDEVEDASLTNFKRRVDEDWKHFWGNYPTTDKLHFDFVMFFLHSILGLEKLLMMENGQVMLEGLCIASMENLPFASENEDYKKMKAELDALPAKIAKKRQRMEQYPEDEEYREEHQELLNRYNALKDEFANYQKNLFATAMRISRMQLEKVDSELERAINEFEIGRIEVANAILDGIEKEAERHVEQLDFNRALIHRDIEALLLRTKTLMSDLSIPVEQRIVNTKAIYQKADGWAIKSALDEKEYANLLLEYASYLQDYAYFKESENIYLKHIRICEKIYGKACPEIACSINNLGVLYQAQKKYDKALNCYTKALVIEENVHKTEHQDIAHYYNNIGGVYHMQKDYDKALDYYLKSLSIKEKEVGKDHPSLASLYHNIGGIYYCKEENGKALEYYSKALEMNERFLGFEHDNTATSYYAIGCLYDQLQNYPRALKYHKKALSIRENILGFKHPVTAASYSAIAQLYLEVAKIYYEHEKYGKALNSYLKSLHILEHELDTGEIEMAMLYNIIGELCHDHLADYSKALDYYFKTLEIREKTNGIFHYDTALCYDNIGWAYFELGEYQKSLDYLYKGLNVLKKILDEDHPETITLMMNINYVKHKWNEDKNICPVL